MRKRAQPLEEAYLKRDYAFVVFEGLPPEENGLRVPRSGERAGSARREAMRKRALPAGRKPILNEIVHP